MLAAVLSTIALFPQAFPDGAVPFSEAGKAEAVRLQAACRPRSLRAAMTCLDKALTPEQRANWLGSPYSRQGYGVGTELSEAVYLAWFDWEAPQLVASSLSREFSRQGFLNTEPAEWLLDTYWLSRNGCDLDVRHRVERDRIIARQITTNVARADAGEEFLDFEEPLKPLPRCRMKTAGVTR